MLLLYVTVRVVAPPVALIVLSVTALSVPNATSPVPVTVAVLPTVAVALTVLCALANAGTISIATAADRIIFLTMLPPEGFGLVPEPFLDPPRRQDMYAASLPR
jgi:hypothetical protein